MSIRKRSRSPDEMEGCMPDRHIVDENGDSHTVGFVPLPDVFDEEMQSLFPPTGAATEAIAEHACDEECARTCAICVLLGNTESRCAAHVSDYRQVANGQFTLLHVVVEDCLPDPFDGGLFLVCTACFSDHFKRLWILVRRIYDSMWKSGCVSLLVDDPDIGKPARMLVDMLVTSKHASVSIARFYYNLQNA